MRARLVAPERDWETTAIGLADENARIAAALSALWEWAVAHQINQHAEDGDAIAAAIVGLVQAALIDRDADVR